MTGVLPLLLGLSGVAPSVTYTLAELRNSVPERRLRAIATFANHRDYRALPALSALVRQERDPRVRRAAVDTLLRYGQIEHWNSHGEGYVAPADVWPLVAAGKSAVPVLIGALGKPAQWSSPAALALGYLGDPSACPALSARTGDVDGLKQYYVFDARWRLRDPRLIECLAQGYPGQRIGGLQVDHLQESSVAALAALGAAPPPSPREARKYMLRLIQAYGLATAAQPLAALLPSLSTEERGEVLRTIAALKNPESESLMAAALRDPDGRVRMAAARYFRARPTATVAADLIRLLDDEEVRESAADALAALRWRPALPVLLRLVQEDPGRVEALADALAATSDPAALQLLASHLRGGDFPSVNPIANSFAKADERALPLLLKTLRAPDPSVRQGAAEALGALRHPGGVPGLIERLQDSDSQEVREAAAHALGEIGDPAAIRPLIAATWTEYHHSLVFESMVALGKLKAREAVPALVSRIGYIRWMLEDPAGEALIEIGPPAVPALIRVLEERGEGASVAARALAFIGDRRAAPALRRALPYPAYTEMCAQGLGKMRDRSALHLLGPLATHPSKGVRIAARRAVARICWDVPASAE